MSSRLPRFLPEIYGAASTSPSGYCIDAALLITFAYWSLEKEGWCAKLCGGCMAVLRLVASERCRCKGRFLVVSAAKLLISIPRWWCSFLIFWLLFEGDAILASFWWLVMLDGPSSELLFSSWWHWAINLWGRWSNGNTPAAFFSASSTPSATASSASMIAISF